MILGTLFLPGIPGTGLGLEAQQPRVTIEALLSAPFPSGLTAASEGGHVAWVENDQGRRNIWVASPPEYVGRRITGYMEVDGQDVGSLAWAPDASTLVYVRGGAPNRQGEIPNPASDPAGAERDLWRISFEGGELVRIGPGSSPAVSLRGDGVAFFRGGAIWFAPLDESAEPSVLVQARGGLGSLRWSPDGSHLASVSNRGTHAFVGVYDLEARTVRWMDTSVDRDANPVWSPDGRRLAFGRVPASGGEATLLTPGGFEVEYVTLSPDRSTVYFNLNQGDIDRRHLWRVLVRGGPVAAPTRGPG